MLDLFLSKINKNIHAIIPTAPTDVSKLGSFLGLRIHYSSFLPEMHQVVDPLNNLLKKDACWNWSPECKLAFDKIKSLPSSEQLLAHCNPFLDIVSDASDCGTRAVMSYIFPDGNKKAIAHTHTQNTVIPQHNYRLK